jgi:hypothetical protein
MAVETKMGRGEPVEQKQPFAHLRATPEELARLLAAAQPFDVESWQRGKVPPTPEELADLDEFLREREDMRQLDLKRQNERLAELGG